jgi:hypothetical protein
MADRKHTSPGPSGTGGKACERWKMESAFGRYHRCSAWFLGRFQSCDLRMVCEERRRRKERVEEWKEAKERKKAVETNATSQTVSRNDEPLILQIHFQS